MELTSNITDFGTYEVGSRIKESGWYVCVPCGYRKYLKAGDHFPKCMQCFGKREKGFSKGLELWERVSD